MVFALSDSLVDGIIFSMEDQDSEWVLDAAAASVVPAAGIACDDQTYYRLPGWTSADGYALLEAFADSVYIPPAREELRHVLQSGRGVFRNFKNVLKLYPQLERKWRSFKNARMKAHVMAWYNTLRESWGLETLEEYSLPEETDELVQDDFVFHEYDSSKDGESVDRVVGLLAKEYEVRFPRELGNALADVWQNLSRFSDEGLKYGFVCHSQSDEFIGCLLYSYCPSSAKKAVVVTDFFVLQNYRGLGIGRALLQECLSSGKERGIHWILISNTIIPESMEPVLAHFGFERLGSGFVLDVRKE